jgi:hypothetical protein
VGNHIQSPKTLIGLVRLIQVPGAAKCGGAAERKVVKPKVANMQNTQTTPKETKILTKIMTKLWKNIVFAATRGDISQKSVWQTPIFDTNVEG